MLVKDVAKLTPLERLCYWILERHKIYKRRQAGEPKPWTDDEILQRYRFCNVRRMDDKVSQWLLNNWYKPYFDHPMMLPACALARHFNLPAALEAIGFPERWRPERIKKTLRSMKQKGERIFNGAYMVRGIETADKTEMVVDWVVAPLVSDPPACTFSSFRETVETLINRRGFGSFMAGQVTADLRWAVSGRWKDKRKWAPVGPGSARGINRFFGRAINEKVTQEQFNVEFAAVMAECKKSLPAGLTRSLEAIDYQNCLCEFDKYERTLFDGRRPKQLFDGI